MGLNFMRNTYQASRTNPALLPDEKLVIALPNFYNHFELTGPSFGDIINTDGDTPFFNLGNIINDLNDINHIRNDAKLETIGVSFRTGGLRLGIHNAAHVSALVNYKKNLANLIWEGNAPYVGQTLDIGIDMQLTGYQELGLTAAYEFKGITLGAGAKFLYGFGDVSTSKSNATFFTDPDVYQLRLQSDFVANTSSFLNYNSFDDYKIEFNPTDFGFDNMFSANTGLAFDFGIDVDLGKLKVAASIIDIGKINWKENVSNYTSNGTFEYDGIDFSNAITGGEANFGSVIDTLEQIFQVTENNTEYSTTIPQKIYFSAIYELTDMWQLGASFYNETYRENSSTGYSLGAQAKISDMISIGGNYSIYNENYANIGLNATGNFGPVQLVLASDNVIGLFDLDNTKYTNFRVGLNLIFGKNKDRSEDVNIGEE